MTRSRSSTSAPLPPTTGHARLRRPADCGRMRRAPATRPLRLAAVAAAGVLAVLPTVGAAPEAHAPGHGRPIRAAPPHARPAAVPIGRDARFHPSPATPRADAGRP